MTEPHALALDLDGTLIDNSARHYWSYCQSIEVTGHPALPFAEYWEMKRAAESWPSILARTGAEEKYPSFRARWAEVIECDEALRMDRMFSYTEAALDRLAEQYTLVLVTLRQDRIGLARQLAELALAARFSEVFTSREVFSIEGTAGIGKREILQRAVGERAGILFYVGDTDSDVAAAKSAGVIAVAVASGIRDRQVLTRSAPDALCDDLSEVPSILPGLLAVRLRPD